MCQIRVRTLHSGHALTTRDIAEGAGAPVASLSLSVAVLVRTTRLAFASIYRRRPAFVALYLRGRNNAAVHRFGREHNARVAQMLQEYAVEAGLPTTELTPTMARLAVEVGDRVFQLAYETEIDG